MPGPVTWEVQDEAVQRGLRSQRREIGRDVKKISLKAAWLRVVPTARSLAPSVFERGVIARSTTRGAYLTVTGTKTMRRTAGLLEFGGTVRTPIFPKKAQALHFEGRFAAAVRGPRTYRPGLRLTTAAKLRAGAFADQVDEDMTAIMRSRIEYARTFS